MRDSRAKHLIGQGFFRLSLQVLRFVLLSHSSSHSWYLVHHTATVHRCAFYHEPAPEGLIVRITINLRSDPTSLGEAAWFLLDRSAAVFKSNSIRRGAAGQQEGRCLRSNTWPRLSTWWMDCFGLVLCFKCEPYIGGIHFTSSLYSISVNS